jgi:hypothetical protein
MNKRDLKTTLSKSREKLLVSIDGLFDEQLQEPGVNGDWSVKDILFHLTKWEAESIKLVWQLSQGETPTTLHFSDLKMDEVNAEWAAQSKTRTLDLVLDDFDGARRQMIRRVDMFKDLDLEDPNRFPALDGEPLWKWIASDTFEHEAEHILQIDAWRKSKDI